MTNKTKNQSPQTKRICKASVTSNLLGNLKRVNDNEPWRCHNKVKEGEEYCHLHKNQSQGIFLTENILCETCKSNLNFHKNREDLDMFDFCDVCKARKKERQRLKAKVSNSFERLKLKLKVHERIKLKVHERINPYIVIEIDKEKKRLGLK